MALSSSDEKCKGEASRAIAYLSANIDVQHILLQEGAIQPIVDAFTSSDINCQRFAALCIANLATSASSQMKVVKGGAIRPLVSIIKDSGCQLEARRYPALALANLSASIANHPALLEEEEILDALFSLANSPDALSKYYVGCTLANFTCNISNHEIIVEKGGLQPIISLVYNTDPNIQQQAASVLRGLSVTEGLNMKIVQEAWNHS